MPSISPTSARSGGASSVGFPWRILVISLVVFGLALLIYAGVQFGYVTYLNSEIKKVDSQFAQLSQTLDDGEQEALLSFYSQLYNIRSLSGGHLYPSRFFDFIERITYASVRFINVQLNVAGGEARIEGVASDFETLTDQIALMEAAPEVSSVALESSKRRDIRDGGGVYFSMKVLFSKTFFVGSRS